MFWLWQSNIPLPFTSWRTSCKNVPSTFHQKRGKQLFSRRYWMDEFRWVNLRKAKNNFSIVCFCNLRAGVFEISWKDSIWVLLTVRASVLTANRAVTSRKKKKRFRRPPLWSNSVVFRWLNSTLRTILMSILPWLKRRSANCQIKNPVNPSSKSPCQLESSNKSIKKPKRHSKQQRRHQLKPTPRWRNS